MSKIVLKEVDKIEILTLQDNYVDLASQDGNDVVQRAMPLKGLNFANSILAEHGFSALVSISCGDTVRTLLFDFGFSETGAFQNSKMLNVNLSTVDMMALSHGHSDHTGGFKAMVEGIGKPGMKLVAHPAAFRQDRVIKITEDFKISMPKLEKDQIEAAGVELIESAAPYPMFDQTLCFLGDIPRKTEFEKGSAAFHYQDSGEEKWDAIDDDTSLVAHVKGKGLVILSGCAHAGIVNTVEYAKEQTGVDQLFAVMGGFHLTGKEFAPIIEPTAMALKEMNPTYIVPTHCTGRDASVRIEQEMPDQFLLNMSGTRMVFEA